METVWQLFNNNFNTWLIYGIRVVFVVILICGVVYVIGRMEERRQKRKARTRD